MPQTVQFAAAAPSIPNWVQGLGEDVLLLPSATELSSWANEIAVEFGRIYLSQHPPGHNTAEQVLVSVIGTQAAESLNLSSDPKLLHEPYITATIRAELHSDCAEKLKNYMDEKLQQTLQLPRPTSNETKLHVTQNKVEQPEVQAFESEVQNYLSKMIQSVPDDSRAAVISEVFSAVLRGQCLDLRSGLNTVANPITILDSQESDHDFDNQSVNFPGFISRQTSCIESQQRSLTHSSKSSSTRISRVPTNAQFGLDNNDTNNNNNNNKKNHPKPTLDKGYGMTSRVFTNSELSNRNNNNNNNTNESGIGDLGMQAIEEQVLGLCHGRCVPIPLVRHLILRQFHRDGQENVVQESIERNSGTRTSAQGVSRLHNMVSHAVNEAYDTTLARYDVEGRRAMSIQIINAVFLFNGASKPSFVHILAPFLHIFSSVSLNINEWVKLFDSFCQVIPGAGSHGTFQSTSALATSILSQLNERDESLLEHITHMCKTRHHVVKSLFALGGAPSEKLQGSYVENLVLPWLRTGLVSLLRPHTLVFVWTQCLLEKRNWGDQLCDFVLDYFVLARPWLLSACTWDDLQMSARQAAQSITTAEWRKQYAKRHDLVLPREPHLEDLERQRAKAGRTAHRGVAMADLYAMLTSLSATPAVGLTKAQAPNTHAPVKAHSASGQRRLATRVGIDEEKSFTTQFVNTLKKEHLPISVCQEQTGAEDSERPLVLVAAEYGHWHLVHALLQLGCSPAARHIESGATLLTSLIIGAVQYGPRETGNILLKLFTSVLRHAEVDINAQLKRSVSIANGVQVVAGSSCLHIAVLGASKCTGSGGGFGFGHPGLVQLLLRSHVDRTLSDANGQLAVELLNAQDRAEFRALLSSLVGSYGKKEIQIADKLSAFACAENKNDAGSKDKQINFRAMKVEHPQRRWILDAVVLSDGQFMWYSLVGAACANGKISLTRQLCRAGCTVLVGAPGLRDPLVLARERKGGKCEAHNDENQDDALVVLLTYLLNGMVGSSHARMRLYLANRLGLKSSE